MSGEVTDDWDVTEDPAVGPDRTPPCPSTSSLAQYVSTPLPVPLTPPPPPPPTYPHIARSLSRARARTLLPPPPTPLRPPAQPSIQQPTPTPPKQEYTDDKDLSTRLRSLYQAGPRSRTPPSPPPRLLRLPRTIARRDECSARPWTIAAPDDCRDESMHPLSGGVGSGASLVGAAAASKPDPPGRARPSRR